jgi:hypothetical protein
VECGRTSDHLTLEDARWELNQRDLQGFLRWELLKVGTILRHRKGDERLCHYAVAVATGALPMISSAARCVRGGRLSVV